MPRDRPASPSTALSFHRRAFVLGARQIVPLALPAIPVGLVLGFVIAESGLALLPAWSTSWIILAGASQLAAIDLLSQQAGAAVVLVTVAFINSRHVIYSAALRPKMAGFPRWFRVLGSYLLIDQVFALAASQPDDLDDRARLWHYLGSGGALWTLWMTSGTSGILVGDVIRPEWQLGFAVPLLFGCLMLLSITNRAGVAAAVVAASVALIGAQLPQGSGVLVAIVAGMVAGTLAETALRDTRGPGEGSESRP